MPTGSKLLLHTGAISSLVVALLQVVMKFGDETTYLALGVPPEMIGPALNAPIRTLTFHVVAIVIFVTFAGYAYSALGLLRPLPGLRASLVVIAAIYIMRGAAVIFDIFFEAPLRAAIYSLVSLAIGITFAILVSRHWSVLREIAAGRTHVREPAATDTG